MHFHVGQKVICINDRLRPGQRWGNGHETCVKAGEIYTVREIVPSDPPDYSEEALRFVEVANFLDEYELPSGKIVWSEVNFRASRFFPVQTTTSTCSWRCWPGRASIGRVAGARPDVVLMDVRMPKLDGIDATRRILAGGRPSPPAVLVLTTFDDDEYVFGTLQAGAAGFLLKDAGPDVLVAAVRTVAAGDALVDPSVTRRLVERWVALEASSSRRRTQCPQRSGP